MVVEVYTRDTITGVCEFRAPIANPSNDNATLAITNGNDGDGVIIVTVTPADGTAPYDLTFPEPTAATTDTFSVLSGQTITFPNGDTINVPVGSTYDPATSTLTTSDGISIDLTSFDTDTDTNTFATFDAATNTITFASGATHTLSGAGTDTFASFDPITEIMTMADGSTVDMSQFDVDTFSTFDAATNTVTFASGATVVIPNGATFDVPSTTLTLGDGTTIDLSSFDTDTFATLAGRVITFADGSTITVPNAATYNSATMVLTLDDGTTINIGAGGVDTFATFDPVTNIVTFADGSTKDLDDVDTDTFIDPTSWVANSTTGIVSYDMLDVDGNVVGTGSINLAGFLSSAHPSVTGGGDVVVTGDAVAGWVVTLDKDVYTAGTDITITGSGTAVDPYVVSSTAGGGGGGALTPFSAGQTASDWFVLISAGGSLPAGPAGVPGYWEFNFTTQFNGSDESFNQSNLINASTFMLPGGFITGPAGGSVHYIWRPT